MSSDLPPWLHRCKPCESRFVGRTLVERCACGATRKNHRGWWIRKNDYRRREKYLKTHRRGKVNGTIH
jgi:hypothetical protein